MRKKGNDMRQIFSNLIVFLAIVPWTYSQEAEPERLSTLRANYTAAVKRATDPLTERYEEELEKLKDVYTRNAQLEAALAVDAELKRIQSKEGGDETEEEKEVSIPKIDGNRKTRSELKAIEKAFVDSMWQTKTNKYYFRSDGTGTRVIGSEVTPFEWELQDNGKVYYSGSGGRKAFIFLTEATGEVLANDDEKQKATMTKLVDATDPVPKE